MIFEMARGAKFLNQLAHLQLLQRCAASWRRGRALVGIIADALRKSEAPTPPTAFASAAAAARACPSSRPRGRYKEYIWPREMQSMYWQH